MKTLEGKLKDQIKVDLKKRGIQFFMPVQSGYGQQTVDFLCCVPPHGRYLAIETKAPGKKPTPRQDQFLNMVAAAGGIAIWCDSFDAYRVATALCGLE